MTLLGAPLGSNGGQKGQKLLTLLKIPQIQKICTARWIFFHQKFNIVTDLLRTTIFDPIWDSIGVKKGKKLPISLKNNPQVLHICACRSCFKRNSMVSFIFDKILYSTTLRFPEIQWGLKMASCMIMSVYKHFFLNKNFMMPVHCSMRCHLCFEQNTYNVGSFIYSLKSRL